MNLLINVAFGASFETLYDFILMINSNDFARNISC